MPNRQRKRSPRKHRRGKGCPVPPGATVEYHTTTGLTTRHTFLEHYKLTGELERHDLDLFSEMTVQLWGSYKVLFVELEVPPGVSCAFRVCSNELKTGGSKEQLLSDPFAVISYNNTPRRQIHRYRPTEAPFNAVQRRSDQYVRTGLMMYLLGLGNGVIDQIHFRCHVLMMDQTA